MNTAIGSATRIRTTAAICALRAILLRSYPGAANPANHAPPRRTGMIIGHVGNAVITAIFAVTFVAGAGALAVWIDRRFPRLAPSEIRPAMLNLFAASVANQFLDAPLGGLVARSSLPGG